MGILSFNFGLEGYIGPLVCAGAILAFLVSFLRPALALYVMVPLLPFQTVRYRLHAYPLGHAFIDLMLLATFIGCLRLGWLRFPKERLRTPLIITVVLTYLSLWKGAAYLSLPWPLWFNDYRLATWKNNVLVPILLFVAVYSAIRTRRQMKILLLLMCLTTAAFNRNVYNSIGQSDRSSFSYDSRAQNGAIGANGLAAFEVQFGYVLLGLAAFDRRWLVKVVYWAIAAFCFYCVMLAYSRGGYLAFLVGWLVLGIVKSRILLIPLVVFLMTWQAVVPNSVRDRVLMTYTADGELENSAAGRVTLWQDAMSVVNVDPVFGVGYNTYEFMHRVGPFTDTHNLYMKILVESGVVGLVVFLMLIVSLTRLGFSTFRIAEDPFVAGLGLGLFLWMVCAVFTNIFGDRWNYIQITGYLWTVAAMIMRCRQTEESDESEEFAAEQELAAAEA